MMVRSYSELIKLKTFLERYEYLQLSGDVGEVTFGFDRNLNQRFYMSIEWRRVRNQVLIRDFGCDLGVTEYPIHIGAVVHHMNPILVEDLSRFNPNVLDPEFLITTSANTHKAIHFGTKELLQLPLVKRKPGDTSLWKSIRRKP